MAPTSPSYWSQNSSIFLSYFFWVWLPHRPLAGLVLEPGPASGPCGERPEEGLSRSRPASTRSPQCGVMGAPAGPCRAVGIGRTNTSHCAQPPGHVLLQGGRAQRQLPLLGPPTHGACWCLASVHPAPEDGGQDQRQGCRPAAPSRHHSTCTCSHCPMMITQCVRQRLSVVPWSPQLRWEVLVHPGSGGWPWSPWLGWVVPVHPGSGGHPSSGRCPASQPRSGISCHEKSTSLF